ncbi:class I SAM-dependent methyltransferase [bacterium]
MNNKNIKDKVTNANKLFYDTIGKDYEMLDKRRNKNLEDWLKKTIKQILYENNLPNANMLDIAAGTGFVLKVLGDLFEKKYAIDVSKEMIKIASEFADFAEVRDVYDTGYEDNMFDFVTCFAGLHHFAEFKGLFEEVYRILKPGGVFYSDHDMELHFYKRFKWFLNIYRKFAGSKAHYKDSKLNDEIYDLTEYNQNGIDSDYIQKLVCDIGFQKVQIKYHWYGLSSATNIIFKDRYYRKAFAPIMQIVVVK